MANLVLLIAPTSSDEESRASAILTYDSAAAAPCKSNNFLRFHVVLRRGAHCSKIQLAAKLFCALQPKEMQTGSLPLIWNRFEVEGLRELLAKNIKSSKIANHIPKVNRHTTDILFSGKRTQKSVKKCQKLGLYCPHPQGNSSKEF